MTDTPINVGLVIHSSMHKARLHKNTRFSFRGLLTKLLKDNGIDENPADHKLPQNLKRVNVIKVKESDTSQGPALTTAERHA